MLRERERFRCLDKEGNVHTVIRKSEMISRHDVTGNELIQEGTSTFVTTEGEKVVFEGGKYVTFPRNNVLTRQDS